MDIIKQFGSKNGELHTLRALTVSITVNIGTGNFKNPPCKTHLENPLLESLDGGGLQVQHHVHFRFLRAHVALHTRDRKLMMELNFRRKIYDNIIIIIIIIKIYCHTNLSFDTRSTGYGIRVYSALIIGWKDRDRKIFKCAASSLT
jgi:hypothetical protein